MQKKIINTVSIAEPGNLHIKIDVDEFIRSAIDRQDVNQSYSPVIQRAIPVRKGIVITGTVQTDFIAEEHPGMDGFSYITVGRKATGKANAQSGYGVAFRPSSPNADINTEITGIDGSDITLDDATMFGDFNIAYIKKDNGSPVAFQYESVDGDVLKNAIFPGNITPEIGDDIYLAEANLFIVDNSYSGESSGRRIMEFGNGEMNYIVSNTFNLTANTEYEYKLVINSNNAIEFYIVESGNDINDPELDPVISSGAYEPIDEYLSEDGTLSFGISVLNTCGSTWYWGPIEIASLVGQKPVLFTEMKVDNMTQEIIAVVSAWGEGFNEGTPANGMELYVLKDGSWELVLTYDEGELPTEPLRSIALDVSEYAENDTMKFYLTTSYPSGTGSNHATLHVNTFYVEAMNPDHLNIGGATDIYIDDELLEETAVSIPVIDGYAYIDTEEAVVDVSVEDNTEGLDFLWIVDDENYRYSTKVENILRFDMNQEIDNISVTYKYSPAVKAAQSQAESAYHSFKANDVLVKHMPIYWVTTQDAYIDKVKSAIDRLVIVNNSLTLSWQAIFGEIIRDADAGTTPAIFSVDEMVESPVRVNISYRENGVPKIMTLSSPQDKITIHKTSTFKVAENE